MKPMSISVEADDRVYVTWENGKKSVHDSDAPVWVHGVVTRDIKRKLARELNIGDDVHEAHTCFSMNMC